MYAIFEDGSRQYRVSVGEVVKVDYRGGEDGEGVPNGTSVEFPRVLLYNKDNNVQIGQPLVQGARILGEVVDHPSTKVYVQKFRRRKNYRRLRGHRQWYTAVRVKHILLAGEQPVEAPPAAPSQEQPKADTAPAQQPAATAAPAPAATEPAPQPPASTEPPASPPAS